MDDLLMNWSNSMREELIFEMEEEHRDAQVQTGHTTLPLRTVLAGYTAQGALTSQGLQTSQAWQTAQAGQTAERGRVSARNGGVLRRRWEASQRNTRQETTPQLLCSGRHRRWLKTEGGSCGRYRATFIALIVEAVGISALPN